MPNEATSLPNYGPLPRPQSLEQARETLKNERFVAPQVDTVEFLATEFSSICPKTGQPDFGTVLIQYRPGSYCLESKSLKFYLWAYRDAGAYCESLAAKIADDVQYALGDAEHIKVTVTQNVRGGIALNTTAERWLGGEEA
jgi:7-cyano-7-deazaguanine reductase